MSRPFVPSDATGGFTRMTVLVKSKALLYSTCDYCGFTTSNTSADKVWAAETDHRDTCNAKKPASASGVQSKRPARSG